MLFPRTRQKLSFLKADQLGSGGYGIVYRATELGSGRAVALKKSRVSLEVKRSLLQHEARVLKMLSGHPTIPDVFGYGRIEHFELLSMQLLDQSLGDIMRDSGPIPLAAVLEIADQMLDVLDHMHSHGLAHRDIKPDNMVLKAPGSWRLCLIDFGLLYRPALTAANQLPRCSPEGPVSIFGTLSYASINAHWAINLTFRDAFESLAYTHIPRSRHLAMSTIYGAWVHPRSASSDTRTKDKLQRTTPCFGASTRIRDARGLCEVAIIRRVAELHRVATKVQTMFKPMAG